MEGFRGTRPRTMEPNNSGRFLETGMHEGLWRACVFAVVALCCGVARVMPGAGGWNPILKGRRPDMRHTCDVTPKNGILNSPKGAEHYYDQFPPTFAKYGRRNNLKHHVSMCFLKNKKMWSRDKSYRI